MSRRSTCNPGMYRGLHAYNKEGRQSTSTLMVCPKKNLPHERWDHRQVCCLHHQHTGGQSPGSARTHTKDVPQVVEHKDRIPRPEVGQGPGPRAPGMAAPPVFDVLFAGVRQLLAVVPQGAGSMMPNRMPNCRWQTTQTSSGCMLRLAAGPRDACLVGGIPDAEGRPRTLWYNLAPRPARQGAVWNGLPQMSGQSAVHACRAGIGDGSGVGVAADIGIMDGRQLYGGAYLLSRHEPYMRSYLHRLGCCHFFINCVRKY